MKLITILVMLGSLFSWVVFTPKKHRMDDYGSFKTTFGGWLFLAVVAIFVTCLIIASTWEWEPL